MPTQTTAQRSPIRAFLVAIALLLASVFATSSVSAGTLIPMTSTGGWGGGTASETVDIADYQVPRVSGVLPF